MGEPTNHDAEFARLTCSKVQVLEQRNRLSWIFKHTFPDSTDIFHGSHSSLTNKRCYGELRIPQVDHEHYKLDEVSETFADGTLIFALSGVLISIETELKMHVFPSDISRQMIWLTACGNEQLMKVLNNQLKYLALCNKHFESKYFLSSELSTTAVAILFLPVNLNNFDKSEENVETYQKLENSPLRLEQTTNMSYTSTDHTSAKKQTVYQKRKEKKNHFIQFKCA